MYNKKCDDAGEKFSFSKRINVRYFNTGFVFNGPKMNHMIFRREIIYNN